MSVVLESIVFFSIISLIIIFLIKLYNILTACSVYDRPMSIITLVIGVIGYFFIEIGLFLNLTLEFNVYQMFSRVLILLIVVFWIVELFIYTAVKIADDDGLSRMMKNRADRFKKG